MNLVIMSVPLFSSFTLLLLGRFIGYRGGLILAVGSAATSLIFSFLALWAQTFNGLVYSFHIKDWFQIGGFSSQFQFIFDRDCLLMVCLISTISFIVICYSTWYLSVDAHLNRFLGFLLIFSVSMFVLVSSKNLLFTFFGWECVGLVSYLLINFWCSSETNNKSAIKALLFNKVGDISFLFGLFSLLFLTNSFDISTFNLMGTPMDSCVHEVHRCSSYSPSDSILFFFVIAAMAKSAQIFLHCWLGDAMAGPTPVSALLHAATMVTAGIFLLLKFHTVLLEASDNIHFLLVVIGSFSILFAGVSSVSQFDIKKIIAFSTCSQIGYMFLALSFSKPLNASFYHLLTHGFFKALLFLSAGLLIHSVCLDQDLRKYGSSLWNSPLPYFFFFIGSVALMGVPPLSGFFSKDLILLHSFNFDSFFIPSVLLVGSFLSSFYSLKILFFSFFNRSPSRVPSYHSSCSVGGTPSLYPLFVLFVGSLFAGFFLSNLLSSPEDISVCLEVTLPSNPFFKLFPLVIPFLSLVVFWVFTRGWSVRFLSNSLHNMFSFFNRKFFFDTFYNYFLIVPTLFASYHYSFKFLDRGFLELFGPVGFFRFFFLFPKNYSLGNQSVLNLPFSFFYLLFGCIALFTCTYM